jgi:hypothetical protein
MTGGGRVVFVDRDCRATEAPATDWPLPTLLVAEVSDAVKQVEGSRVTFDLDRSLLWAVQGIAVDRTTVETLPEGSFTMAEVIQRVAAAGHAWDTTLL